jgi:hypothetical protein
MSLLTIARRYYDERLACRNFERLMGEKPGLGFDDPGRVKERWGAGEKRKEPSTYFFSYC